MLCGPVICNVDWILFHVMWACTMLYEHGWLVLHIVMGNQHDFYIRKCWHNANNHISGKAWKWCCSRKDKFHLLLWYSDCIASQARFCFCQAPKEQHSHCSVARNISHQQSLPNSSPSKNKTGGTQQTKKNKKNKQKLKHSKSRLNSTKKSQCCLSFCEFHGGNVRHNFRIYLQRSPARYSFEMP